MSVPNPPALHHLDLGASSSRAGTCCPTPPRLPHRRHAERGPGQRRAAAAHVQRHVGVHDRVHRRGPARWTPAVLLRPPGAVRRRVVVLPEQHATAVRPRGRSRRWPSPTTYGPSTVVTEHWASSSWRWSAAGPWAGSRPWCGRCATPDAVRRRGAVRATLRKPGPSARCSATCTWTHCAATPRSRRASTPPPPTSASVCAGTRRRSPHGRLLPHVPRRGVARARGSPPATASCRASCRPTSCRWTPTTCSRRPPSGRHPTSQQPWPAATWTPRWPG